SSAMLAQAREKPLLHHRLVRGNCLALPFRSQSADLVICSFVMSHVPQLAELAREIVRVMKPRSDLYAGDLHPDAYALGWRTGFRQGNGTGSREIAAFGRSLDCVLGTFRAQGLELVDCLEPHLSDAERTIFEQTGKAHLFGRARELPAVLICHFRR